MAVYPYNSKRPCGRPYYRMSASFSATKKIRKNSYDPEYLKGLEAKIRELNLSFEEAKVFVKNYPPPPQSPKPLNEFYISLHRIKNYKPTVHYPEGSERWNLMLQIKGEKTTTKYSYDYDYLLRLKQKVLDLRENGGSYEEAREMILKYPALPKRPRPRKV
jgi:hypothetical protein